MGKGKCVAFKNVYSPATGGYIRKCKTFSGGGGLSGLGQSSSLKASLMDVKDVVITGGIAAAGVLISDKLFDLIAGGMDLEGWERNLAQAATGIALGIIVGKFLKKPRLAATLAVGPVVFAALRLFGDLMKVGPFAPSVAGLGRMGLVDVEPFYQAQPALLDYASAPGLGMVQAGPGVPERLLYPGVIAGALAGA